MKLFVVLVAFALFGLLAIAPYINPDREEHEERRRGIWKRK